MKMLIEIRKTAFINKGAELMLNAALQKMRSVYPDARYAMAPNLRSAPYHKRAELGLYQKAWLQRYKVQWGHLAALAPRKIRELFGIVLDKEIDVVLDAAGFSYSDQWGPGATFELAKSCMRWRKQGTKVILLPQAFGPFSTPRIRDAIKKAADNIDLLFARERVSYQFLVDVVGERPNIKIAPDFTNLIEGIVPDSFDRNTNKFCIVPNYRMIDKTSKEQSEAYLPFLINCVQYLKDREQSPFLLIHEGANDLMLARKIADAVKGEVPIVKEDHPLKIKGIIGSCEGAISSRFHGLVSALSQGVPSLATGWSHKYQMLFEDYGFSDGMMDVTMDSEETHAKIDSIITPPSKERVRVTLCERSRALKQESETMWAEVFRCIDR